MSSRRATGRVHKLVAAAFLGPQPPGTMVLHADGNPANNAADNLYFGTPEDNMADKIRHGRNYQVNKLMCPRGHELREPNLVPFTRSQGQRACLSCHKAWFAHKRPGRTIDWGMLADRIYPILMAGRWPQRTGAIQALMRELVAPAE